MPSDLLDLLTSSSTAKNSAVTVEHLDNLLQRNLLRLNIVFPDHKDLKRQEDTVDEVVFPVNVFQGDRVDVLVEPKTEINAEEHESQTLGTETVRQNLGGVGDKHAAESDIVRDIVEEDEGNDCVGCVAIGSGSILVETSECNGSRDKAYEHADAGREEKLATAEVIHEEADSGCRYDVDSAENEVDSELSVAVCDSDHFQNLVLSVFHDSRPVGIIQGHTVGRKYETMPFPDH